jgi:hypothetical protein
MSDTKQFPISLDEFLQRLSQTDRRVELIHGFYAHEKKAGHVRGLESEFRTRFDAFINMPA